MRVGKNKRKARAKMCDSPHSAALHLSTIFGACARETLREKFHKQERTKRTRNKQNHSYCSESANSVNLSKDEQSVVRTPSIHITSTERRLTRQLVHEKYIQNNKFISSPLFHPHNSQNKLKMIATTQTSAVCS